jgi:hypothetical protein
LYKFDEKMCGGYLGYLWLSKSRRIRRLDCLDPLSHKNPATPLVVSYVKTLDMSLRCSLVSRPRFVATFLFQLRAAIPKRSILGHTNGDSRTYLWGLAVGPEAFISSPSILHLLLLFLSFMMIPLPPLSSLNNRGSRVL